MAISATAVKTLRDRTNLPMMECKAALTEAGGDMDKAIEILAQSSRTRTVKFAGRETAEGRIAVYIDTDKKIGAIVEVRCETPPVAKSDAFVQLANDLAKQIALKNPASVEALLEQDIGGGKTVQDRITEAIGLIRENMKVEPLHPRRPACSAATSITTARSACWCRSRAPRPMPQVLRDVAMHVTARNPVAGKRERRAGRTIAKEMEIAQAQMRTTRRTRTSRPTSSRRSSKAR